MRRGFTITEMLVVIAVTALLMGLLAPALSSVRAAGRGTQCQSNLRQMAVAAQGYANLFNHWPAAYRFDTCGGVTQFVAWDWVTSPGGQLLSPGPLWMYSDYPDRVMQCPEYHGNSNTLGDPFTGYNYNTSYLGGEGALASHPPDDCGGWRPIEQGGTFRRGVRPVQCRRAAECAMFGCGGYASGASKYMRAPLNREGFSLMTIYSGGQAFRHRGTTNVAHVDGHVGLLQRPWEGELATPALLSQFMAFPRNGFLSNDDSMYDPR